MGKDAVESVYKIGISLYNQPCTICLRGTGAPLVFPGPEDICTGDLVRVELDADIFKAMQEGHGGWSDPMLEVSKGDVGTNVQVRIPPVNVITCYHVTI